jgi:EAL domain-containing protein (putative c-di-GMP-specific phosphodiesterase class I)
VVLLDLTLPDGRGLEVFDQVTEAAPNALILQQTGLAPHYLERELTESILMHDAGSSASVLQALKAMGVRLAIDDFGTGYSSLSYLKRFPIDTLKIGQSFVRDIVNDLDDATMVAAVIGMGKNLKRRVIAEGGGNARAACVVAGSTLRPGSRFSFQSLLARRGLRAAA